MYVCMYVQYTSSGQHHLRRTGFKFKFKLEIGDIDNFVYDYYEARISQLLFPLPLGGREYIDYLVILQ